MKAILDAQGEQNKETNTVPVHVNDREVSEEIDNTKQTLSRNRLAENKKTDVKKTNGCLGEDNALTYVGSETDVESVQEPLMRKENAKVSSTTLAKKKHQCAVFIDDVSYSYGNFEALKNITSKISIGEIYGLLGPSGCGKTTLLRCIVGVTKPKSGEITVFGNKPGTAQSSVPGPGVGYMPQDIALYIEFTIEETINYFGQIYGLPKNVRQKRLKFLVKFLDLPEAKRQINALSGGQKRRVSLAAALVHNPPLLILDEPTVGADPLLRESIWQHLVELTKTENMTIIITTHYIEEARQAYKVGLMRGGQLLIDEKPSVLLERYNATTLETVFLKICELAKNSPKVFEAEMKKSRIITEEKIAFINLTGRKPLAIGKSFNKISALINKGTIRLRRNILELIFQTILPAIQIILFCLCVGQDPTDLNLGIYDPDQNYSLKFIDELDPNAFNFQYYSNLEEAIDAVKGGNIWAALTFDENYTYYVNKRFQLFTNVSQEVLSKSTIKVYSDMTEFPIHVTIMAQMFNATDKFVRKLVESTPFQLSSEDGSFGSQIIYSFLDRNKNVLSANKKAVAEPYLEFVQPPVYGTSKPSFRDFAAPGLILAITYTLAVGLTALAFVIDRKGGQLERTLIAGVHPVHILIGHIIIQVAITLLQTTFLLISVFIVFSISLEGSIILVVILTLVQGITGMSFGLLISALCREEQMAIIIAVASFWPTLILSGIFWPLEGMPCGVRYISYFLPQTLPIAALRSIINRGWDLTYPTVWLGFVSSLSWIALFNFLAVIVFLFNN